MLVKLRRQKTRIERFYKPNNLSVPIKCSRLERLRHRFRMAETKVVIRIVGSKPEGKVVGRPKFR